MKALPYYRLYPKDFDTDEAMRLLDVSESGLYLWCLNHAWVNDGLPAEPEEIRRALKVTARVFSKLWPRVSKCFMVCSDGRLRSKRQEEERAIAMGKSFTAGASSAHSVKQKVPGSVYLIRRGDGTVKIGSSNNVAQRLAQLRYKYQENLSLIGTVPSESMGDLEVSLHARYSALRVIGEWFRLSEGDIEAILSITPQGDIRGDRGYNPTYNPSPRALARAESVSVSGSVSGFDFDFFDGIWKRWKRQRRDQPMQVVVQLVSGREGFNFGEFRANAPPYIAWCEAMKPEPWKYASLTLWEWIEGGMILPPEAAPERDPLEGI
jgi:uncharacterized protein YdaU (DUF1376 family)